ncbi:MAG: hypothetical protein U1D30_06745 [Planctomycetota bacterium]
MQAEYYGFEEQRTLWARKPFVAWNEVNASCGWSMTRIRRQCQAIGAGYLAFDLDTIARQMPRVMDDMQRLVEENSRARTSFPPRTSIAKQVPVSRSCWASTAPIEVRTLASSDDAANNKSQDEPGVVAPFT